MYALDDTIAAISSALPAPGQSARIILRLSGPQAAQILAAQFGLDKLRRRGVLPITLAVDAGLSAAGVAYCFAAPASYTGQNVIELHLETAPCVVSRILDRLLAAGIRQAAPGEFTQRAYINGKLDLSQAEAVMHIISASTTQQLAAAQRLLAGGLSAPVAACRARILELLSLLEAELDFADEPIAFIHKPQAIERIDRAIADMQDLLGSAVRCEDFLDLPSVGLCGCPNAGKSSLLNALTGRQRSIISEQPATTRDILTEPLDLPAVRCILFDCAGLLAAAPDDLLDQLAQQAAAESLQHAALILFCVDSTAGLFDEPLAICQALTNRNILCIATKTDLLEPAAIPQKLRALSTIFHVDFISISANTGAGTETLKHAIESRLTAVPRQDSLAITHRHRIQLQETVKLLGQTADEIRQSRTEIAAMLLRSAWHILGGLERQQIEERILDEIFSKFCIGK